MHPDAIFGYLQTHPKQPSAPETVPPAPDTAPSAPDAAPPSLFEAVDAEEAALDQKGPADLSTFIEVLCTLTPRALVELRAAKQTVGRALREEQLHKAELHGQLHREAELHPELRLADAGHAAEGEVAEHVARVTFLLLCQRQARLELVKVAVGQVAAGERGEAGADGCCDANLARSEVDGQIGAALATHGSARVKDICRVLL